MTECAVCLGPHDAEIHRATVAVRGWFREQVLLSFGGVELAPRKGTQVGLLHLCRAKEKLGRRVKKADGVA